MVWTDESIQAVIAEISNDPKGLGYSAMTDDEIAAAINEERAPDFTDPDELAYISSNEPIEIPRIMNRISFLECVNWRSSTHPAAQTAWELMNSPSTGGHVQGDYLYTLAIYFGPGGDAPIFSQGTVSKVLSLITSVSRRKLLGLPTMTGQRVTFIRGYI